MAADPAADALLAFASGVPLIALGGLLLALRPWRREQAFFGSFAILWGIQVCTINLGRILCNAEVHHTLLLVSNAFMMVATMMLAHFAGLVRGGRRRFWPTYVFGTTSVLALIVYIVDPRLLVVSAALGPDATCTLTTTYGPLITPLIHVPFFAAFAFTIVHLYLAYRRARPGTPRARLRGIMLALTLFTSYQFMRTVVAFVDFGSAASFASGAVITTSTASGALLVGSFFLGTMALLAIAVVAIIKPPAPEAPDLGILAAVIFPATVALLEDVLADHNVIQLETLGFWRLVSVAVLTYTIANYQLFDLELRLKRLAGPGTATVIVLFGIPLTLELAEGGFGLRATSLAMLPEAIGVAAVMLFRERLGERLFPGVRDDSEYEHQRGLELYRVALEDAVARGRDPEAAQMEATRRRFRISESEHRLLLWMIRSEQGASPGHGTRLAPGNVVLDRYRLDKTLRERPDKETFLATDQRNHQPVIVKAVRLDPNDPASKRLLLREARLGATISHPNVLAIFDVAEQDDHLIVVMDYADAGNLRNALDHHGHMAPRNAIRFLRDVLLGLHAIHSQGIIHRNLKPENILIDADGTALIADLSAAARGADSGPPPPRIGTRQAAATGADATGSPDAPAAPMAAQASDLTGALLDPLYMSPEQVAGRDVDARSDLYVAAVLFHIALTGRHPLPIAGRTDLQIRRLVQEAPPELHLDKTHEWARPLLLCALAKDPAARHPDAAAMAAELSDRAGIRTDLGGI